MTEPAPCPTCRGEAGKRCPVCGGTGHTPAVLPQVVLTDREIFPAGLIPDVEPPGLPKK